MKTIIKQCALPFLLIILLFSCKNDAEKKEEYFNDEIKPKLVEKYNCFNVDDCLSKYEFEGAREFVSEMIKFDDYGYRKSFEKIINSETIYWLDNKEYERAYKIVKEYDSGGAFSEYENSEKQYKIIEDIISSLLSDGNIKEAYLWALKASTTKDPSGYSAGSAYSDSGSTQQQVLIEKIETAKKVLKKTM